MATERVYIVTSKEGSERLVNASLRQQALSHVANCDYTVRVASQQDLVRLLPTGVAVESYKNPDQLEIEA